MKKSLYNINGGSTTPSSRSPIVAKQTLKEDIIIRSIKILDIVYITFIYGIPAIIVAAYLDKYIYNKINFDESIPDDKKTESMIFIELLVCLSINSVVAYLMRNILHLIPFPLNGVYGFDHMRVGEVKSGAIIAMILLWFSTGIRKKISVFHNNIVDYI